MKHKIFLDLDGVCIDFVSGLKRKFNYPYEWPEGTYKIDKVLGIPNNELWIQLDVDFWKNLPKSSECDMLVTLLDKFDVCLLTALPHYTDGTIREISAQGKLHWIKENMAPFFYNDLYLIGNCKYFCASENAILIDDSERKIEKFEKAGGKGILFPQPWNRNKHIKTLKVEFVKNELKKILGENYE